MMAKAGNSTTTVNLQSNLMTLNHACGPCQYEGVKSGGNSYCQVCRKHLCTECVRAHKKNAASRHHVIVVDREDKECMSLANTHMGHNPVSEVEFCCHHPSNFVDFYCSHHNDVFCGECKLIKHRKCEGVALIAHISAGMKDSQQLKDLMTRVESLVTKFTTVQTKWKEVLSGIHTQKEQCLQKISEIHKEISQFLDRFESETKKAVEAKASEELTRVDDQLAVLGAGLKSLKKVKLLTESVPEGGDKLAFIVIKKTEFTAVEAMLLEVEDSDVKVDFKPHAAWKEMFSKISAMNNLGEVTVGFTKLNKAVTENICALNQNSSSESKLTTEHQPKMQDRETVNPAGIELSAYLSSDLKEKKLVHEGEVDVKYSEDKYPCKIVGLVFLPDGSCVLADEANSRIQYRNKFIKHEKCLKLHSPPYDLAYFSPREVVVTLPFRMELQFLRVGSELNSGRVIKLEKNCFGVAVHNSELYVTCHNILGEGEVFVLSQTGETLLKIGISQSGQYNLECPLSIAVDVDGKKIYVNDCANNSISCIYVDKHYGVKHRHPVDQGKASARLRLDRDGYVYFCTASDNSSIEIFSPEWKKYKTLLGGGRGLLGMWRLEGIGSAITTFACRSSDNLMVVAMQGKGKLQLYKFV